MPAVGVEDVDAGVGAGEFADALAAVAAGRAQVFAGAHHVDLANLLAAAADHGGDGRGLGTQPLVVGDLDVAAEILAAVGALHQRGDGMPGVGHIGVPLDLSQALHDIPRYLAHGVPPAEWRAASSRSTASRAISIISSKVFWRSLLDSESPRTM